jgi:hypothetical protein
MSEPCSFCKGEGWVCEYHPKTKWHFGDGCCEGAGIPCECNQASPPWTFQRYDE